MKNVLIHSNRKELDRDLSPVQYNKLYERQQKNGGGNVGNKLFLTAVESYLRHPNIHYEYLNDSMTVEYINESFDLIVWPLANCFNPSKEILGYIEKYAEIIEQYKVPVLALGAGAQASTDENINDLAKLIRPQASRFIRSVYNTGGIFGLRGYYTKYLFETLGYHDDVVIGCPSMYQCGKNLRIEKKELSTPLIPALNGNKKSIEIYNQSHIFDKYEKSIFIDQGNYIDVLYNHKYEKGFSADHICSLLSKYSKDELLLLSENRVICLYDLAIIVKEIIKRKINFSFGQRIHGNILCTLIGIPSVVAYCDSRTKELANFFNIPTFKIEKDSFIDLNEIYNNSSWNDFNSSFPKKFDDFNKLIMNYNIPSIENRKTDYFLDTEGRHLPEYINDTSQLKKAVDKYYNC